MNKPQIYIISLGGSLIAPKEGIDWKFLKKFRELIINETEKGSRFFIITGGGQTCRQYLAAATKVVKITADDLDWLGIHSTRLNAHLIRTIFRDLAHPVMIKDPTVRVKTGKKIVVAGGWKPGWSTDYVATVLAEMYKIKKIINLSNIDYVCDKDPRKHADAKAIESIEWQDFRKIVGDKWDPGLNAPFDPIASKKAEELGLEVVIANGKNQSNLKNYFSGKRFRGTIIRKNGKKTIA